MYEHRSHAPITRAAFRMRMLRKTGALPSGFTKVLYSVVSWIASPPIRPISMS